MNIKLNRKQEAESADTAFSYAIKCRFGLPFRFAPVIRIHGWLNFLLTPRGRQHLN
jgi:hypothetical protein